MISFEEGSCPDCHRPRNIGGVHNPGCALFPVRLCLLCQSQHRSGDDCHRDRDGAYCSLDAAIARMVERSPGWTRERCEQEVSLRSAAMARVRTVVDWLRADPIHVEALKLALRCAPRPW
jgi:hypothetical protein